MAPEQIRSSAVDERSDLYSLGVTFYEMLTGRLPVEGPTTYEVMQAHAAGPPIPPSRLLPSLPVEVSDVIMKSLAKTPSDRYPTALAFQSALRNGLFGESPTSTFTGHAASSASPAAPALPPPVLQPADLQRVEQHLAAAIGPIARNLVTRAASRYTSLPLLCQDLANQIDDPAQRATFLRTFGVATESKSPHQSDPQITTHSRITEAALEVARKALAEHLGPMAGIVVNRAAKRVRTAEELADLLAADLPDDQTREAFRARLRL
jgi:serine/threonine-protein kinase